MTEKTTRNYQYTSRYSRFPVYYNRKDKRYVYGLTSNLKKGTDELEYTVRPGDTLDSIAFQYYGRPDLYWIIADYNKISDSFINLYENYRTLILPNMLTIEFKD